MFGSEATSAPPSQKSHAIRLTELFSSPRKVGIATTLLQYIKGSQGNCMRHCWGTMTMLHTRSGHDQDRSRNMRSRNRRLGPLVQDPPPPLPGRHHTTTSRKSTHNNTKGSGLNKPPQNPGLDTPAEGHCTRYEALHPLRGAAPVTRRCTRYVAIHPNRRGAMPTDRVQCLQIGCTTPSVTSSHADLPERTSTDPTGLAEPGGAVQTAG